MARFPRTLLAGFPHHIMQRGHDRQPVFVDDSDYHFYLNNLRELKIALDVRIYGFCLMTNHVHLLLEPRQSGASVSVLMKGLAARQTRHVNRLEGRSGTLWEGRFKCSLIDTDQYLLACMRYVDLNPVRAALVDRPQAYPWSSYRSLAGYEPVTWLDEHAMLRAMAGGSGSWQTAYASFVAEGVSADELSLIRAAIQRNQLTGDNQFCEQIAQRIGRRVEFRGPGRPGK